MRTAILSIGTELTRGELIDRNSGWLSDRLTGLGCTVVQHATVGDVPEDIRYAIVDLASRSQLLLVTGGLGPTTDDITAKAAAEAAGVTLVRHDSSLEAIRRRFAAAGREVTALVEKQADLPAGADAIRNATGTAPGFALKIGECQLYFFPGVPREMQQMFADEVEPRVAPEVVRTSDQVRLRTFGLPESQVGELLDGVEDTYPGVTIGYRASFPEIEVKVHAVGADGSTASARMHEATDEVRRRLGGAVFGEGGLTYPAYVGRVLRDRGLTLALAESCTGGLASAMLTDIPGSSDYVLVSAVTYSNASKTRVLGVPDELLRAYGAVSAECAEAMALGARRISDADIAVSITGIAGPGGGTESKPVGTVFLAICRRGEPARTEALKLAGDREKIRMRAAYLALQLVAQTALG
ncbi:MAG: competence/damage-inducible protein A [Sandaracinaceae bacterium]